MDARSVAARYLGIEVMPLWARSMVRREWALRVYGGSPEWCRRHWWTLRSVMGW